MHTYEMVGVADGNTRTYESKYGTYNKEDRFVLSDYAKGLSKKDLLDEITHVDCWKLKQERKKMSIAQIEEALGYPVEITDDLNSSIDKLIEFLYGRE